MKLDKGRLLMSLGALGVVFGDIGTSPLYALSELFFAHSGSVKLEQDAVLGIVSLIIWALTLVISVKYLQLVMRASNDGEGGVFALYGLLYRFRKEKRQVAPLLTLLILAAGFLFGDGMITPAISVLSAVEGLNFSFPALQALIVPISMIILAALFFLQRKGTQRVGIAFGPVLLVWFLAIALLGLRQVREQPEILKALNPYYAALYLRSCSFATLFVVFGGVVLAITGGEALYADMGHFDASSIRRSWFAVVYPALILNYLGQGAYLLSGRPVQFGNIFFSGIPQELRLPMLLLATAATVIASQALISGVFSLATQAVALGLFPRLSIRYTHDRHSGQVYVPMVNWFLLCGCLALVAGFRASAGLASAYGLAVSANMFLTSLAMISLSQHAWGWGRVKSVAIFGAFVLIDLVFLGANSSKLLEGGYIPLAIGLALFLIMTSWRWGRKATYEAYAAAKTMRVEDLIERHRRQGSFPQKNLLLLVPKPVQGVSQPAPALLQMVYDRYGILARNIFFVQILHKKVPYHHHERCGVTVFERNDNGMIAGVNVNFGFMENPDVEAALEEIARHREILLDSDARHWVFHVSQELIRSSGKRSTWHELRKILFTLLRQVSRPAYVYYGLGDEVQLSIQIIPVKI